MDTTQTDKAVQFYRQGNLKKCLAIFKTFRSGLSKQEMSTIGVAYECLNGHEHTYKQLGIDVEEEKNKAKTIIDNYIKKYYNGK